MYCLGSYMSIYILVLVVYGNIRDHIWQLIYWYRLFVATLGIIYGN